jgi:predicted restriction endonuclease
MRAYDARCAVTGCTVTEVLEAAHLQRYRGTHTNRVTNGLLLRADIHTLLDYKLWAPNPDTRAVAISKRLAGTQYNELSGCRIAEPVSPEERPLASALEKVWREFLNAEAAR